MLLRSFQDIECFTARALTQAECSREIKRTINEQAQVWSSALVRLVDRLVANAPARRLIQPAGNDEEGFK
jgi:hypothetical protein